MHNTEDPAPDTAALMAQFNDLLLTFGNLAFDCGEFDLSEDTEAEYDGICAKKSETEAQLRRLFRSVLSK